MPRMHVNLRPSTISFDDGENPVVSGIARLGAAMAALPPQLQHLRMQQAAAEEDDHRFSVMQDMREREFGLHENADQRAGEEHGLKMQTSTAEAIRHGDIEPQINDPLNLSPHEEHDLQIQGEGEDLRKAQIQHLTMQHKGNAASDRWIPVTDKDTGETLRMNERTGETQPLRDKKGAAPHAAVPAAPAPVDGGPGYADNSLGGLASAAWGKMTGPSAAAPTDDGNGAIRAMNGGNAGPMVVPAQMPAQSAPGSVGPKEQALHAQLQQALAGKHPELPDVAFHTLMNGHADEVRMLMADHPEIRDIVRRTYGAQPAPAAAPQIAP